MARRPSIIDPSTGLPIEFDDDPSEPPATEPEPEPKPPARVTPIRGHRQAGEIAAEALDKLQPKDQEEPRKRGRPTKAERRKRDGRLAWMKFYPKDWTGDAALSQCSLATKGAWLEIVIAIWDQQDSGSITFESKALARYLGVGGDELLRILSELKTSGTAGVEMCADKAGTIPGEPVDKAVDNLLANGINEQLSPQLSGKVRVFWTITCYRLEREAQRLVKERERKRNKRRGQGRTNAK